MRILLISPNALDPRLGAAKVTLELADAFNGIAGVRCELAGPAQLGTTREFSAAGWRRFSQAQREFLRARAREFDVVDYDHEHLPYARSDFHSTPLFVARSVLLVHHLKRIRFPVPITPRTLLARVVRGRARDRFTRARLADAARTIQEADLVNVSNEDDRRELAAWGVDPEKVVVFPFGLMPARRMELAQASRLEPPEAPVVAFVGTFDFRKGAADFPALLRRIHAAVPSVRLALLGTRGHFHDAHQVLQFFPRRLRSRIEVHPVFPPADLPRLLSRCSVGVFPSYCEGFGFGVLEMLAAALPVVAYDAPGPPAMLPREWLVPPGDTATMGDKIIRLLVDRTALADARASARRSAMSFEWPTIAEGTVKAYEQRLRARPAHDRAVLAR